jgi:ribonuclease H2 subunit A
MKMLRRNKYSLNAISHDSAIGLVRKALAANVNVTEVYVDTVGPPEKYQEMLSNIFPSK